MEDCFWRSFHLKTESEENETRKVVSSERFERMDLYVTCFLSKIECCKMCKYLHRYDIRR